MFDGKSGMRHTPRLGGAQKVPEDEAAHAGKSSVSNPAAAAESIVTICAECKRVIGSGGRPAGSLPGLVSHGICPDCARRLYGRFFEPREPKKKG